jgi:hypothetical protein
MAVTMARTRKITSKTLSPEEAASIRAAIAEREEQRRIIDREAAEQRRAWRALARMAPRQAKPQAATHDGALMKQAKRAFTTLYGNAIPSLPVKAIHAKLLEQMAQDAKAQNRKASGFSLRSCERLLQSLRQPKP